MRCADATAAAAMIAEIDRAKKDGDTRRRRRRGRRARRRAAGLGAFAQWDRRLDGRIAQALMSIHAVKAVAIGDGLRGRPRRAAPPSTTRSSGTPRAGSRRPTNRAGGLEGGITNGEEIRASPW